MSRPIWRSPCTGNQFLCLKYVLVSFLTRQIWSFFPRHPFLPITSYLFHSENRLFIQFTLKHEHSQRSFFCPSCSFRFPVRCSMGYQPRLNFCFYLNTRSQSVLVCTQTNKVNWEIPLVDINQRGIVNRFGQSMRIVKNCMAYEMVYHVLLTSSWPIRNYGSPRYFCFIIFRHAKIVVTSLFFLFLSRGPEVRWSVIIDHMIDVDHWANPKCLAIDQTGFKFVHCGWKRPKSTKPMSTENQAVRMIPIALFQNRAKCAWIPPMSRGAVAQFWVCIGNHSLALLVR